MTAAPVGAHDPAAGFAERFATLRRRFGPLVLGLDPSSAVLDAWGLADDADGLERFAERALGAAEGAVGVLKPQAAFYERHGWRGVRVLARLVEAARGAGMLVIVDAKRGDIGSTNDGYAAGFFGDGAPLACDALTVQPYLGLAAMGPLVRAAHAFGAALFVVVRSSNPEGRAVQEARVADGRRVEELLLSEIGQLNDELAPGELGPIGAVVAASTHLPPLELLRAHALYLVPGIGAQGATASQVASSFASCPERVLPSISRSLLGHGPDPARLHDAIAAAGEELSSLLA